MISDRTIEEETAKYWCAFADKNFKKALDTITATIASEQSQDIAQNIVTQQIEDNSNAMSLNEGFLDFLSKLSPTDPTGGSVGIVSDLTGKSKDEIKANAVAMATAAGATATTLTPVGRAVTGSVIKTGVKHPVAAGLTVAASKLALDAAGNENDAWWQKLGKLVNKVWDIGKFTAKHAKTIAIASTIAYALFKTANIWMPLVSSCIKSILRGNSLATLDFDSNGIWYRMRYDIKYKRWELLYKNFSMGSTPPPEDTEQLLKTKFFKRFLSQCQKYIEPIVDNSQRTAVLEAISKLSDKQTKDALDKVFNDSSTLKNMFALKFKY